MDFKKNIARGRRKKATSKSKHLHKLESKEKKGTIEDIAKVDYINAQARKNER